MFEMTKECETTIDAWNGIQTQPNPENLKKGGIQIYQKPWVDKFLASAHPASPYFWVVPVILFSFYYSLAMQEMSLVATLVWFFSGVLFWTFAEYLLHRFVFHFFQRAIRSSLKRFLFLMHGYHHEFPNHESRLVAPPMMALILAPPLLGLIYLALGPVVWLAFSGGFLLGYLGYDEVHVYVHHVNPKNSVGKYLRSFHTIHHYQNEKVNFGISSPLWDVVFRTYYYPKTEGIKLKVSPQG